MYDAHICLGSWITWALYMLFRTASPWVLILCLHTIVHMMKGMVEMGDFHGWKYSNILFLSGMQQSLEKTEDSLLRRLTLLLVFATCVFGHSQSTTRTLFLVMVAAIGLILTWSYSSTIVLCCCWSFNCIVVRQWIDCLSMISFEWSLRSWLSSSNTLPMSLITLIISCTCVTNSF